MGRKRNRAGILIRLVDVILIMLFGFLMIARIQQQVDIALPNSQGQNESAPSDSKYFDVFVYSDGTIAAGRSRLELVRMPLPSTGDDEGRSEQYEILRERLDRLNAGRQTVVIRSEFNAPVQYTVDLLDICKELDMPKSIRCFETAQASMGGGG